MTSTTNSGRVRIIALLHPKDGVPFEEFDKHWSQIHAPLFQSLGIVKMNLLKYEQVRSKSS